MKKIVFYLAGLDNNGGSERVIANLSNFLSEKYEVTIITTGFSKSRYELNRRITRKSLDSNVDKSKKNRIIKNISRIKTLNQLIKKIDPDIVITFLPNEIYRILFLKKFSIKAPVIISFRDDPAIEYETKIRKRLMNYLIRYADGIIFQTKEAGDFFKKQLLKDKTIIPNPINEEFMSKIYYGEREKIIVAVGRLEPQKNHELLIEAFFNISRTHKEYKLHIYGEGSLRENLEEKIKELGLENKVFLKGTSSNIREKIYRSSLFVLSSNHEGMPNALMEAMALGLPVVSTDCPCGGPNFLIENKVNGLLVKVGDKTGLENAIVEILQDPEYAKKLGENARNITKRLEPTKIYGKWQSYIEEIIKISRN